MSNKKEITVDVSGFGGSLDGYKFLLQQIEYRSEFDRAPTIQMQVLGVAPRDQQVIEAMMEGRAVHGAVFQEKIDSADIKLANDALKSAADLYGQPKSQPVPEGVSIHHDLERRFTIAYSISKSGRLAFVGVAYCSPHDQFCRRTGRELAISRLDERPCRVVKLPRVMAPGTDDYPKNGAEWRAVEQSILLGLGLLR